MKRLSDAYSLRVVLLRVAVWHFGASSWAVKGFHVVTRQIHVEGAIDATVVWHYRYR